MTVRMPLKAGWVLPLAGVLVLGGCGTGKEARLVTSTHQSRAAEIADTVTAAPQPYTGVTIHRGAMVTGQVVRQGRGDPLPAQWEAQGAWVPKWAASGATLREFAAAVTERTGIPVLLVDGAELPQGAPPPGLNTSRGSGAQSAGRTSSPASPQPVGAASENGARLLDAVNSLASGVGTATQAAEERRLIATPAGRLSDILNAVSAAFGADWRYRNGRIEFYRFVTESFDLEALPQSVSFSSGGTSQSGTSRSGTRNNESSIGDPAAGSGPAQSRTPIEFSNGSAGTEGMAASQSVAMDYWVDIERSLASILPADSRFSLNPSTGRLDVVARPSVMDQVRQWVVKENRTAGREVEVRIEVVSVNLTTDEKFGLDLKAVLTRAGKGLNLGLAGPAAALGDDVGKLSIGVVNGGSLSELAGSTAALQALAEAGGATVAQKVSGRGTNNGLIRVALTENVDVVRGSRTVFIPDTGAVTTSQIGTLTTGFTFISVPRMLGDGRIKLALGLTVSGITGSERVQDGNNGFNTLTRSVENRYEHVFTMRSGESVVMSGFIEDTARESRRGSFSPWNVLLGGSISGDTGRRQIFIIVTPVEVGTP